MFKLFQYNKLKDKTSINQIHSPILQKKLQSQNVTINNYYENIEDNKYTNTFSQQILFKPFQTE